MEIGRGWVEWEEVVVSNDKGKREVHYYLKDLSGVKDLAVLGREKSVRHMSYEVLGTFLRSIAAARGKDDGEMAEEEEAAFSLRWRSRREVVDWLSSLVSDSYSHGSSPMVDRYLEDEDDTDPADIHLLKDLSSGKVRNHSKDFTWLGPAWNCRKRRKHFRSFCRNGITISVHDFVYVMAEDHKRLVAHVEDLYEDMRSNKMVVVQWFHKVDEVALLLPADVNNREIFFSFCLQDLSVECIDGLAAVLSLQHFEKFQSEARQSIWQPHLCRRQIDNDDIKAFDVTQVKGYWSQEVLRSMFSSSLKLKLKISHGGSSVHGEANGSSHGGSSVHGEANGSSHGGSSVHGEANGFSLPPRSGSKRKYQVYGGDIDACKMNKSRCGGNKADKLNPNTNSTVPSTTKWIKQKVSPQLAPGCHVEVLSQDSGIRGCWLRGVVLKRYQDKVKVQYDDVQDADGDGNLQEWVLASRLTGPDKLGIRMCGRPVVRPRPFHVDKTLLRFEVGAIVDAWWHDGWWEGIVIRKDSDEKVHVYLTGERQVCLFGQIDLRLSQDWVCSKWNHVKQRLDIVDSLLDVGNQVKLSPRCDPVQPSGSDRQPESDQRRECLPCDEVVGPKSGGGPSIRKEAEGNLPDLAMHCQTNGLRWSSSRKRKRVRGDSKSSSSSDHKRPCNGSSSSSSSRDEAEESFASEHFDLPKSRMVEHENCKIGGDPLFSAPMAISSLVLSR